MTENHKRSLQKRRQSRKLITAIEWLRSLCSETTLNQHHLCAPIQQLCKQAQEVLDKPEDGDVTLYLTIVVNDLDILIDSGEKDNTLPDLQWPLKKKSQLLIKPFVQLSNKHTIIRSDSSQPDFEIHVAQENEDKENKISFNFFEVPQIHYKDFQALKEDWEKTGFTLEKLQLYEEDKNRESSGNKKSKHELRLDEKKLIAIQTNRAIRFIRLAIKLLNRFLNEETERNQTIQLINQDKADALKQLINEEKKIKKHNKQLGDAIAASLTEQIVTTRERIEQDFLKYDLTVKSKQLEQNKQTSINPPTTNKKLEQGKIKETNNKEIELKLKDGKLAEETLTAWAEQQDTLLGETQAHFKGFQQQRFMKTMETVFLSHSIDQGSLVETQIGSPDILETQNKQLQEQIGVEKKLLAQNNYSPEAWYVTSFKILRSAPMQVALFASILLIPALSWVVILTEIIYQKISISAVSCSDVKLVTSSKLCVLPGVSEVISGDKASGVINGLLKTSFPLVLGITVWFTFKERKNLREKQRKKAKFDLGKKHQSLRKKILASLVKAYQAHLKASSPQVISNALYTAANEDLRRKRQEIGRNNEAIKAALNANKQRLKQLNKLLQTASKNEQKLQELSQRELFQ